jgi:phosphopantothenoylcysteine decarboxylase/phosphopantothenate--cysteine ligase
LARLIGGVGGGIAAYKTATLIRQLARAGHQIRVVPTEASLHFVGVATWQALSGEIATSSVFDHADYANHIALAQQADLVIVAPATADLLAKLAHGLADDLLTCTILATCAPVLLAPAMHTQMWLNPATQANLQTLTARGFRLIGPGQGPLAGPPSQPDNPAGPGRMSEPLEIAEAAAALLQPHQPLRCYRVLITAGGTHEPIDPVRHLANGSSGRQGFALAKTARQLGATVDLVAANSLLPTPFGVTRHDVVTAAQMHQVVMNLAADCDIVVMAAAVADFTLAEPGSVKLKRSGRDGLTLHLVPTVDILAELVGSRQERQIIVGFAAETDSTDQQLLAAGSAKARSKGTDLLVLNQVGPGIGIASQNNRVWLLNHHGEQVGQADGSKKHVAEVIMSHLCAMVTGHESN